MTFYEKPLIYPLGDAALVVTFGTTVDERHNMLVRSLDLVLTQSDMFGIRECVPAYSTLTVYYDPLSLSYDTVYQFLYQLVGKLEIEERKVKEEKVIPVWYNGPDLTDVSQHTGLTIEEIIAIHTAKCYHVYMLGFVPGFPYLGGMDKRLATPRKAIPRVKIPAGSVGIAGEQTGIYPLDTPGGWQIIGQTPMVMFDMRSQDHPARVAAGDLLRFVSIEEGEFWDLKRREDGH